MRVLLQARGERFRRDGARQIDPIWSGQRCLSDVAFAQEFRFRCWRKNDSILFRSRWTSAPDCLSLLQSSGQASVAGTVAIVSAHSGTETPFCGRLQKNESRTFWLGKISSSIETVLEAKMHGKIGNHVFPKRERFWFRFPLPTLKSFGPISSDFESILSGYSCCRIGISRCTHCASFSGSPPQNQRRYADVMSKKTSLEVYSSQQLLPSVLHLWRAFVFCGTKSCCLVKRCEICSSPPNCQWCTVWRAASIRRNRRSVSPVRSEMSVRSFASSSFCSKSEIRDPISSSVAIRWTSWTRSGKFFCWGSTVSC